MEYLKRNWVLITAIFAGLVLILSAGLRFRAVLQETDAPLPPRTIVIDAGHGGEDGGASAADGTLESGLNLAFAQRLDALLRLCGYRTKMIRTEDVAIYSAGAHSISEKKVSDLRNRVERVNATPRALLVSIHQNSFPDPKYAGAQVFYAKTAGSRELAEAVQAALREHLDPRNHREVKSAGDSVYLMKKISCTGILVECGFLTNVQECARLKQPAYQLKLSLALAQALTGYLTEERAEHEV